MINPQFLILSLLFTISLSLMILLIGIIIIERRKERINKMRKEIRRYSNERGYNVG